MLCLKMYVYNVFGKKKNYTPKKSLLIDSSVPSITLFYTTLEKFLFPKDGHSSISYFTCS